VRDFFNPKTRALNPTLMHARQWRTQ